MDYQNFYRSQSLNNVPYKKYQLHISNLSKFQLTPRQESLKKLEYSRYHSSNIPIEYWNLNINKDFTGSVLLKSTYDSYVADLSKSFQDGTSICLAGQHGTGKTFTACSILKSASLKDYQCLYTTLSDAVAVLTSAPYEDRFVARKELSMVDFLVIDEFDNRFMASDNAAELYARTLETIFRTRISNKLPTIMCTNSPNVIESFSGALRSSIESLFKGYLQIIPVFGKDHRKGDS